MTLPSDPLPFSFSGGQIGRLQMEVEWLKKSCPFPLMSDGQ